MAQAVFAAALVQRELAPPPREADAFEKGGQRGNHRGDGQGRGQGEEAAGDADQGQRIAQEG